MLTTIYDKFFVVTTGDTYRVLKIIQMKLILLCVWEEGAVLGSAKTALKFKYEIKNSQHIYNSMTGPGHGGVKRAAHF